MPEQLHHRYSPSKLERIMLCPGSVRLGDQFPEQETSTYAEEGTLLHAHMAEALDLWPEPYVPETKEPEHRRLILECLTQVKHIMATMGGDHIMFNDQKVAMRNIDCEGTLDLALFNANVLHVIDFKFGGGIEVSPDNNPQLLAYADGALALVEQDYPNWNGEVYLHIFQPRLDAYPVWRCFEEDLLDFNERLERAIRLVESKNPPIHPGIKQCKWCPAGGSCTIRHREAYANAVLAMDTIADTAPMETMSIEHLAKILYTRKSVEAAFANIELYLFNQLKQGVQVPGYKLTTGRQSRKWKEHVDAFILGESLNVDEVDLLDTKLRSPAQVEKLLNKAGKKALEVFYDVIEGPISIASELSKKEAIQCGAQHVFREVFDDAERANISGNIKYVPLD